MGVLPDGTNDKRWCAEHGFYRATCEEAGLHPCPIPSSITGQPCLLPEGHPQDSPYRFHRYAPTRPKSLGDPR